MKLGSNQVLSEFTQTNHVFGCDFGKKVQPILTPRFQITPEPPQITQDHTRSSANHVFGTYFHNQASQKQIFFTVPSQNLGQIQLLSEIQSSAIFVGNHSMKKKVRYGLPPYIQNVPQHLFIQYQFCIFFNIVQKAFAPSPPSPLVLNIWQRILGLYEDICQAFTNSAIFF